MSICQTLLRAQSSLIGVSSTLEWTISAYKHRHAKNMSPACTVPTALEWDRRPNNQKASLAILSWGTSISRDSIT